MNIQTIDVVWYFIASTYLGSVGAKNSAKSLNFVVPLP